MAFKDDTRNGNNCQEDKENSGTSCGFIRLSDRSDAILPPDIAIYEFKSIYFPDVYH